MRIGFIDARSNTKDAHPVFAEIVEKTANVQVEGLTAPNPFKVPAAAKRLFSQGVDSIIAFVTSDDDHELGFLRDKLADVEISEGKYVFLVFEDSNVLADQMRQDLEHALNEALSYAPPEPKQPEAGAMDMFSVPGQQGEGESEVNDLLGDEEVHKLF